MLRMNRDKIPSAGRFLVDAAAAQMRAVFADIRRTFPDMAVVWLYYFALSITFCGILITPTLSWRENDLFVTSS